MKKIGTILLILAFALQLSGQEKSTENKVAADRKELKVLESLEKKGSSSEYNKDTLVLNQSVEKKNRSSPAKIFQKISGNFIIIVR